MEIGKGTRLYIERKWGCEACRQEEPRASVMPSHMESLDPDFLAALERVPEEAGKEKE